MAGGVNPYLRDFLCALGSHPDFVPIVTNRLLSVGAVVVRCVHCRRTLSWSSLDSKTRIKLGYEDRWLDGEGWPIYGPLHWPKRLRLQRKATTCTTCQAPLPDHHEGCPECSPYIYSIRSKEERT